MSALYEEMMTECCFMDKVHVPDGMGGWEEEWADGATFKAAIHKDSTLQARIAEKQGVNELYTITVFRDNNLQFHDVIKRLSDGKTFRVTSNMTDNTSPVFSGINFGQVTAEEAVNVNGIQ